MKVTRRVSNITAEDVGGVPIEELENADITFMPTGGIIMWPYDVSLIPSGWALCDGQNGTPNLNASMYKQTISGQDNIGDTGGSFAWPYEFIINHAGQTDKHALTIDEIPAHDHGLSTGSRVFDYNRPDNEDRPFLYSGTLTTQYACAPVGSDQGHDHNIAFTITEYSTLGITEPPNIRLAFIIYTGE